MTVQLASRTESSNAYCGIGVDIVWGNLLRAYFPDSLTSRASKDAHANYADILCLVSRASWSAASGYPAFILSGLLPDACRQSRAMAGVVFNVACRVGTIGPFPLQVAYRVSRA